VTELRYALLLITYVRARAAEARRTGRSELGASALEWAIISAIVVGLAVIITAVIRNVVQDKANEIEQAP
jgi:ABC-type multidrug transport system permease subunit